MAHIIVVEDEKSIADTIEHGLKRDGHTVDIFMRGGMALAAIHSGNFDLAILDVGLPDINGFELCKAIRAFSCLPVIFLTARDDEIDRIVGLEIGADDYITKPFSPRELAARVKSLLRRSSGFATITVAPGQNQATGLELSQTTGAALAPATISGQETVEREHKLAVNVANNSAVHINGNAAVRAVASSHNSYADTASQHPAQGKPQNSALLLDEEKYQASCFGQKLSLTRYEFKLLALLAARPGKVYPRAILMQIIWGDDSPSMDRTVDAHIKSIRAKCKAIQANFDPIITKRGLGYALREDL